MHVLFEVPSSPTPDTCHNQACFGLMKQDRDPPMIGGPERRTEVAKGCGPWRFRQAELLSQGQNVTLGVCSPRLQGAVSTHAGRAREV